MGLGIVGIVAGILAAGDQSHEQFAELARGVAGHLLLQLLAEFLLIAGPDSADLVRGAGAEDLDQDGLIRSQSLNLSVPTRFRRECSTFMACFSCFRSYSRGVSIRARAAFSRSPPSFLSKALTSSCPYLTL